MELYEKTGAKLDQLARKSGKARNAVIRQALSDWVERKGELRWPKEVVEFKGIKGSPRFESYRGKLRKPTGDPLA